MFPQLLHMLVRLNIPRRVRAGFRLMRTTYRHLRAGYRLIRLYPRHALAVVLAQNPIEQGCFPGT